MIDDLISAENAQALLDRSGSFTDQSLYANAEGLCRTVVAQDAEITRLRVQVEGFAGLLARAEEELRLIRMKDTGAVYDVGLRIDMNAALATYQQAKEGGE